MIDAFAAEALKLRCHRATWLMVWIYPIGATLILGILLIHDVVAPAKPGGDALTAAQWIDQSAAIWGAPLSALGRYLIAGFCAVAVAGEYGWNTWKLIIPARRRWQLIVAKWAIIFLFLYAAFLVADLLWLAAALLRPLAGGPPVPAGVTLAAVVRAHASGMLGALLPTAYTIACAGLLAILTRSVLATVLLSIALISIEQLLGLFAIFLGSYTPELTRLLVEILPFYHVGNVIAWVKTGRELGFAIGASGTFRIDYQVSLAAAAAWTAICAIATVVLFKGQDQN